MYVPKIVVSTQKVKSVYNFKILDSTFLIVVDFVQFLVLSPYQWSSEMHIKDCRIYNFFPSVWVPNTHI